MGAEEVHHQSREVASALGQSFERPPGYVLWTVAAICFIGGDVVTTFVGMSQGGISEANPLVWQVLTEYGPGPFVGLKVAIMGFGYVIWTTISEWVRDTIPLALALNGLGLTLWNLCVLASVLV